MNYLISAIIGYLLGSFPTAYVLLKQFKNIDITRAGSQNVGALNSYESSNSKALGIAVLLIDLLKGFLSVYILKIIYPNNFIFPAISLMFAVFSHCYSPWIKFKGGRGLATAAGGSLLLSPIIPITWMIIWAIAYYRTKSIHAGNIAGTVLTFLLAASSARLLGKYSFPPAQNSWEYIIFVTAILGLIFIKHIGPLKDYIKELKQKENRFGNEKRQ